jgi:hypothetical protein
MSGGKAAFFSTVEDSVFHLGALSKGGSASLKTMPKLAAEGARELPARRQRQL